MLPGLAERLNKEIKSLASPETNVEIISTPNVENQVWVGGALLASLSYFQDMLVSKKEYRESGPSIIHRKCI